MLLDPVKRKKKEA
jgi:hypothetical protein